MGPRRTTRGVSDETTDDEKTAAKGDQGGLLRRGLLAQQGQAEAAQVRHDLGGPRRLPPRPIRRLKKYVVSYPTRITP